MEDEGAGGPEIISPFAPQRVHFFQTEPSLSVSCPLKSCPSASILVREVSCPQEVHLYIVTPSEVQVAGVVVLLLGLGLLLLGLGLLAVQLA